MIEPGRQILEEEHIKGLKYKISNSGKGTCYRVKVQNWKRTILQG